VGYLPLGNEGSNLFFQVISARHEKKRRSSQPICRSLIGEKSLIAPPWPRPSPIGLSTTRKSLSWRDPAIEQNQKQENKMIEK
jgi:hypothetical protein